MMVCYYWIINKNVRSVRGGGTSMEDDCQKMILELVKECDDKKVLEHIIRILLAYKAKETIN